MHARIVAIAVLLCALIAMPAAEAARSGTYRCLIAVPTDGVAWILHHNPNPIAQTVTRIRLWNAAGDAGDTGPITLEIPPNGSEIVLPFDGTVANETGVFQVLVSWTQAQDKAAPLPRTDLFPDGTFTSAVRTPCP